MESAPILEIWQRIMQHRRERDWPRATMAYMNMADLADFSAEVHDHVSARYVLGPTRGPGNFNLYGVDLRREDGVTPGWVVVEAEQGRSGRTIATYPLRCFDHDECRTNVVMSRLCLADRKKREDEPALFGQSEKESTDR